MLGPNKEPAMWIMLFLFPATVFSTVVDSREECDLLWMVNQAHFMLTGQDVEAACFQTWAV